MSYLYLMKHIILTLFCASCLAVAAAQEGGGFYMSPTQIRQLASASIDPSMMGTAKGSITSEAGGPVAEANVTLIGGGGFASVWCGSSKKNGSYSVRAMYGLYNAEITAPGYEKKIVEIDVPKEGQVTVDAVLTPKADCAAGGAGNGLKSSDDGYTLTVGRNKFYEGKSLTDVLADAPAVDLDASPATVAGEEDFEIFVDGREVRVAPDALRKYFGSIAADEVKQIRVVRGNKFQKYPAKLYVTTK